MIMSKQTLTQERVKELLHYDPDTGVVTRRFATNRNVIGSVFGGKIKIQGKTYLQGNLDGRFYYVHRLIWFYMVGKFPAHTDHEDGNGENNRWDNLRDAKTSAENNKNRRLRTDNKSGHAGVSWHKPSSKWVSKISRESLGYFDDWFEAVCARKSAEIKHGYHANNGTVRPL